MRKTTIAPKGDGDGKVLVQVISAPKKKSQKKPSNTLDVITEEREYQKK
jgi:hypothetical protein